MNDSTYSLKLPFQKMKGHLSSVSRQSRASVSSGCHLLSSLKDCELDEHDTRELEIDFATVSEAAKRGCAICSAIYDVIIAARDQKSALAMVDEFSISKEKYKPLKIACKLKASDESEEEKREFALYRISGKFRLPQWIQALVGLCVDASF